MCALDGPIRVLHAGTFLLDAGMKSGSSFRVPVTYSVGSVPLSGILSFGLPLLPPSFSPQSSVSIKLSVTDCGNGTIG
jgi:hypothetical protein